MTTTSTTLAPVCARHSERPKVATCDDCGTPMCARCAVDVPNVGTFCVACGTWRAGVRARRPRRYQPLAAAPSDGAAQSFRPDALPVERRLISGLTERLRAAGVDPAAVVDDESLFGDMERLRERPVRDEPHHWWRRRAS